uniref:Uncharacterized protein n=1 Tax=Anguilla anguilla TaxID=7936 RepID=A0A0E9S6T8_ANGAN
MDLIQPSTQSPSSIHLFEFQISII